MLFKSHLAPVAVTPDPSAQDSTAHITFDVSTQVAGDELSAATPPHYILPLTEADFTQSNQLAAPASGTHGIPQLLADQTITGDEFNNSLTGGYGADTIQGGGGMDTIHGGAGSDVLFGNAGNDLIYADGGDNDQLLGGEGADTLVGGSAAGSITVMTGGEGHDVFVYNGATEYRPVFTGSDGTKTVEPVFTGSTVLVKDFEAGVDHVDVSHTGFARADLTYLEWGPDSIAILGPGNGTGDNVLFILEHVSMSDFHAEYSVLDASNVWG